MDSNELQIKYEARIDLGNHNNSHTAVIELVETLGRRPLRILEVGCSSGYMGAHLKSLGHTVAGVEPSPAAAQAARAVLDDVHCGTLESFMQSWNGERFDVVTLSDVIEHIADTGEALAVCTSLLVPEGRIAISVPNVTHGSVRAMLLQGRWDYRDFGILDRTHLRFFSRSGLIDALDASAMGILELRRTTQPVRTVLDQTHPDIDRRLSEIVQVCGRGDDDLETFQFIGLLAPQSSSDAAAAMNTRWRQAALPRFDQAVSASPRKALHRRLKAARWLLGWH